MDRPLVFRLNRPQIIDGFAQGVKEPSGYLLAYGDSYREAVGNCGKSSHKAFRCIKGNASYNASSSLLEDFCDNVIFALTAVLVNDDPDGIIYLGNFPASELTVYDRSYYLNYFSLCHYDLSC